MKPGSSFKVLIEPAVLRIWNVWKTRQLFVIIKFAPDTDIGRHEWHAGGNDITSASGASHLYTRDALKKQALVGTARKAFSLVRSYWELLPPNPLLTQSILKISESVTRSKVSDQCLRQGCWKSKISHRLRSLMQIWCIYGDKRKTETRNVVHLMAATIFIALLNMRYWPQDRWKRYSTGDALSISP